jgi:hypothetical protein
MQMLRHLDISNADQSAIFIHLIKSKYENDLKQMTDLCEDSSG